MSKIIKNLKTAKDSIIGLFYPDYCPGCGEALVGGEHYICTDCIMNLPYAYFDNSRKNIISEMLLGRFSLEKANTLCYFVKKGRLQKLLHKLKYECKPEIGTELGIYLGHELVKSDLSDFDVIIPVPIHPKKKKIRGYNQSTAIAIGIAQIINKPVDTKSIIRTVFTDTQTKKNKTERWENVKNIFEVKNHQKLINKHILIVDDVITTGATIESLGNVIEEIRGTKISVATLAVAKKM